MAGGIRAQKSLSDNYIQRRINDMADDIREQLVENLKKSPHFAVQFDEATDISGCVQFVVFLRYKSGLVAKLKSILPNASWTHCFLQR